MISLRGPTGGIIPGEKEQLPSQRPFRRKECPNVFSGVGSLMAELS